MTLDRSLIGSASEPQTFEVERGAIVKFAAAIGDSQPDYLSGEAAPPTFPTTFWIDLPAFEGIDPARFLHGEEEYVYERPIRAGDRLTCISRVVDLTEKETRLGAVTFGVVETEGREDGGDLVFTAKTTLIIR